MAYRGRPKFEARAPTTIGAFVAGVLACRRGAETAEPPYSGKKDRRAWIQGWNSVSKTQLAVPDMVENKPRQHTDPDQLESGVIHEAAAVAKRRGWYIERRNTGVVQTDGGMFRYGSRGAADTFVVVNGLHIEAEAKRRDGKGRLSLVQQEFQARCAQYRIPYFVYTSGSEFEEQVDKILLDKHQ